MNGADDARPGGQSGGNQDDGPLHAVRAAALDRSVDQGREPLPCVGVLRDQAAAAEHGPHLPHATFGDVVALAVPLPQSAVGAEERPADFLRFVLRNRHAIGGCRIADEALGGLAVEEPEVAVALNRHFPVPTDEDGPGRNLHAENRLPLSDGLEIPTRAPEGGASNSI